MKYPPPPLSSPFEAFYSARQASNSGSEGKNSEKGAFYSDFGARDLRGDAFCSVAATICSVGGGKNWEGGGVRWVGYLGSSGGTRCKRAPTKVETKKGDRTQQPKRVHYNSFNMYPLKGLRKILAKDVFRLYKNNSCIFSRVLEKLNFRYL